MDDYYDHRPTLRLPAPLALCGLPGSRVADVAKRFSILTGVPIFEVDRAVEHRAGMSLDALLLTQGEGARADAERAVLAANLRHPIPHVIVLGDTTLTDPTRRALLAGADVAYVEVPLDVLWPRLAAAVREASHRHWTLLWGEAPDPALLGPLFSERATAMRAAATRIVDGTTATPRVLAEQLISALPR